MKLPLLRLAAIALPLSCAWLPAAARDSGLRTVDLYRGPSQSAAALIPSPASREQQAVAERLDRHGLLYSGKVVVDRDTRTLTPPDSVAAFAGSGYVLAREPAQIAFGVIPVPDLWLDDPPKVSATANKNNHGPWSSWANADEDRRTGHFWTAVGDHGTYSARVHLVHYDPGARKITVHPEINRTVFGRTRSQFGDGKIHGQLNFYQAQGMRRPQLWFATFWCKYPEPDPEDFATGYDGSHLMSLDVSTGRLTDYGAPRPGSSWPMHRIDTRRGMLYGVTNYGEFLAWDINARKALWNGYLPKGLSWYERALMIDEETGAVYSTNYDHDNWRWWHGEHVSQPKPIHFIKYDPLRNRIVRLDAQVPREAGGTSRVKAGTYSQLRAYTWNRGPDGLFWCITYGGQMFTFDPRTETVVDRGLCWPGAERYTVSIDRSPGGRYLYYVPGGHGTGDRVGTPVVQYDTATSAKKVLAFLHPFYREKYGYTASGTFSLRLSQGGDRLFITMNGAFVERGDETDQGTYGQCSIMLVDIPEAERRE
ncbi:MAG: hypothetical protein JNG83_08120 [Opitutaceae bacterium]|nr:hypothetical protein [Opitutaceae bacterium]